MTMIMISSTFNVYLFQGFISFLAIITSAQVETTKMQVISRGRTCRRVWRSAGESCISRCDLLAPTTSTTIYTGNTTNCPTRCKDTVPP